MAMSMPLPDVRGNRAVALITGASEGLGRELARVLAEGGYDLVLVARNELRLTELARELEVAWGGSVEVWPADLCRPEHRAALVDKVRDEPGLKVLINNAAVGHIGAFAELPAGKIQQMIALDLEALMLLSQAALCNEDFRRGGILLNAGSIGGSVPMPLDATYGAIKAAVDSFTRAIAHEVAVDPDIDVHVQLARIGGLRTAWLDRAGGRVAPGRLDRAPTDWLNDDADRAARIIWRKTRRRRRVVLTHNLAGRLQDRLFRLLPRLGSRLVHRGCLAEQERRLGV